MDLWQLHDWYKCWRFSFMKPLMAFSQFSNQTNQTMFRFSQMLQKSKSCTVWTVRASRSQNCSQKSFLCGAIPSPLFKLLSLFCRGDPITFLPDILSSSGEQSLPWVPGAQQVQPHHCFPGSLFPGMPWWWLHPACAPAWKRMLILSHRRLHIMGRTDSIRCEDAENSL